MSKHDKRIESLEDLVRDLQWQLSIERLRLSAPRAEFAPLMREDGEHIGWLLVVNGQTHGYYVDREGQPLSFDVQETE